jgi:hypothetical protein
VELDPVPAAEPSDPPSPPKVPEYVEREPAVELDETPPSAPVARTKRRRGSRTTAGAVRAPGETQVEHESAPRSPRPGPRLAADDAAGASGVSAGANREIDTMLKSAMDGTRGEHGAEMAALPPLTRDAIVGVMKPLRPRIKECYRQHGQRGLALVRVRVGEAGKVAASQVEGTFAGSPTGACVEAIVKTVRFPVSAGLSFRYPFPVR